MITAQGSIRPVPDTGKVMEIGMLRTIAMVREMAGQDAEVTAGWDREDAGNDHIQGATVPPDQHDIENY
jgi:hypothetical protein